MKITRLVVKNFKSISEIDIVLSNFNVVIGANASGKSNLIGLLKFLRDIEEYGLENAISLQGGRDYFLNLTISRSKPFYVEIEMEGKPKSGRLIKKGNEHFGIGVENIKYALEIAFNKRGKGYLVSKDELIVGFEVKKLEGGKDGGLKEIEKLNSISVKLENNKGKVESLLLGKQDNKINLEDVVPPFACLRPADRHTTLLTHPFIRMILTDRTITDFKVYDFDPKSMKNASPIIGKIELEENASNLPVVLRRILNDKKDHQKIVDVISDLVPFIKDMRVMETSDKSLRVEVKEHYSMDIFIPSTLVSDGTAHVSALVVALYYGKESIAIFEEPDRNLHPSLRRRLVEHMKEMSSIDKQIIVTTHDTEMLRALELDDVIFMFRDSNGFTCMERLKGRDDVKTFLKNEIGLDELYADNLLEN